MRHISMVEGRAGVFVLLLLFTFLGLSHTTYAAVSKEPTLKNCTLAGRVAGADGTFVLPAEAEQDTSYFTTACFIMGGVSENLTARLYALKDGDTQAVILRTMPFSFKAPARGITITSDAPLKAGTYQLSVRLATEKGTVLAGEQHFKVTVAELHPQVAAAREKAAEDQAAATSQKPETGATQKQVILPLLALLIGLIGLVIIIVMRKKTILPVIFIAFGAIGYIFFGQSLTVYAADATAGEGWGWGYLSNTTSCGPGVELGVTEVGRGNISVTCASSGSDTCNPGETVQLIGTVTLWSTDGGWNNNTASLLYSGPGGASGTLFSQSGLPTDGTWSGQSSFTAPTTPGTYTITPDFRMVPDFGGLTRCGNSKFHNGPTNTAGTFTVAASNCPQTTIDNCVLQSTPPGGNSGSCSTGYSGSCNYACSSTGTWTKNSNTCAKPPTCSLTIDSGLTSVSKPPLGSIDYHLGSTDATNGQGSYTSTCGYSGNWKTGASWDVTEHVPNTPNCTFTMNYSVTGPGGSANCNSITVNVSGSPVAGSCAATHNNCTAGTTASSPAPSSDTSYYYWYCDGLNGGVQSGQCKESKSTAPTPTCDSFSASPSTISTGGSATLSWQTSNGTSVSIDQGIGSVAANGSKSVSPSQSTTYTLTVSDGSNSAQCQTAVTVPACTPQNGACGTATGGTYSSAPTTGLCNSSFGDSGVSDSGSYWSWSCKSNSCGSASPASCTANKPPKPSTPSPSYTCSTDGTSVTFNYGVSGAVEYFLRFDDPANNISPLSCTYGWLCSTPPDYEVNDYTSSTYTVSPITPNHQYHFWAHAGNGGSNWTTDISDAGHVYFSCTPNPTGTDGQCNNSTTYGCTIGTPINQSNNYTNWTWQCKSPDGGNNSGQCQLNKSPYITGTGCSIQQGQGSCQGSISWNDPEPVSGARVTVTPPTPPSTVSTNPSGNNVPQTLTKGSYTYTLYDGGTYLDNATLTADCQSGLIWDSASATCVQPTGPNISATDCAITYNANSCTSAVAWTNLSGGVNYTYSGTVFVNPPSLVSSLQTGNKNVTIYYGTGSDNAFYEPSGNPITYADATCASNLTWNGTACVCSSGSTWDSLSKSCVSNTPYSCTGSDPANATLCSGDNQNLTANTPKTLVSSCGAPKCEFTCSLGYILSGGSCVSACDPNTGNSCTSDPNNCNETNSGTIQCDGSCSATTPRYRASCSACDANTGSICTSDANNCADTNIGTINCDGTCNAKVPDDRSCSCTSESSESCGNTSYYCIGRDPANATLCSGDGQDLTANTLKTLVSTCGAPKCEFTCSPGYILSGGSCTLNVCFGRTIENCQLPNANDRETKDGKCTNTGKCSYLCNAPNWSKVTNNCHTDPTLTASKVYVKPGDPVDLNWSMGSADTCTLSGPNLPKTYTKVTNPTGQGTERVTINAKSTYTLSCTGFNDVSVTIFILPTGYES